MARAETKHGVYIKWKLKLFDLSSASKSKILKNQLWSQAKPNFVIFTTAKGGDEWGKGGIFGQYKHKIVILEHGLLCQNLP